MAAESLAQKPIADGADIASFFLPGPDFWLFKGWLPAAPHGESNHFLGYLPLALGFLGLLTLARERGRVPAARSFVAMAGAWFMGVGALISVGAYPHFMGVSLGASPYLVILNSVPTLRGMATVERAGVLVHIGLALLAAVGAERVFRHRRGPVLALVLAAWARRSSGRTRARDFGCPRVRNCPRVSLPGRGQRARGRGSGVSRSTPSFPRALSLFLDLPLAPRAPGPGLVLPARP